MSWREAAVIGVVVAMLATSRAEAQAHSRRRPRPAPTGSASGSCRRPGTSPSATTSRPPRGWEADPCLSRPAGRRLAAAARGRGEGRRPERLGRGRSGRPHRPGHHVLHRPAPGGPGGRVLLPHARRDPDGGHRRARRISSNVSLSTRIPSSREAGRPACAPSASRQQGIDGGVRLRAVDGDKALGDFLEAIRLDPKDASAYHGCGLIRSRKDEYDGAIDDFTRAIGLEPGNAKNAPPPRLRVGQQGRV